MTEIPNFPAITLSFEDNPQVLGLTDPRRLPVYLDRWRSQVVGELPGVFVVCNESGRQIWWAEPVAYVKSPSELWDTLLNRDKNVTSLTAGGFMSAEEINFTFSSVPPATLYEYTIRAFGSHQCSEEHLILFDDARILIESRDVGWGTVSAILDRYGLSFAGA